MMSDDEQLERELTEAARGLTFMSESDYPLEVVRWRDVSEVTPEHLRALSGEDESAPVEVVSAEVVFRAMASEPDWKGAAEIDAARGYQKLMRLLVERLTDLKAYRVGTINVAIYVVGRTSGGDWLGVSTRSVET